MAFLRGGMVPTLVFAQSFKGLVLLLVSDDFSGNRGILLNFVFDLDLQDFIFVEGHGFVRCVCHSVCVVIEGLNLC